MDRAEQLRNTSLALHELEAPLERQQAIVEELADPDLEEAFKEYVSQIHSYRRWLYPQLEEAGIV